MKYLTLFLMTVALRLSAAPTLVITYTMTHVVNDENTVFCFPSGDAEKYYTSATLAVIIEDVYVDGVAVTAMPYGGSIRGDFDTRTYQPVLPARMVYRLTCQQLVSSKSRDKKGTLEFVQYDLPADSKKIEFTYRIRYPEGRMSGEMHLVSIGTDEIVRPEKP